MNELDKCWRNQMSLSRWLAQHKEQYRSCYAAKSAWLRKRGYSIYELENECFFCDYNRSHTRLGCVVCPGILVDETFSCMNDDYNYATEPKKFYNKLRSLNRKRLTIIERQKND